MASFHESEHWQCTICDKTAQAQNNPQESLPAPSSTFHQNDSP